VAFPSLARLAGIEPTTLGFGGQTKFITPDFTNHSKSSQSVIKRQFCASLLSFSPQQSTPKDAKFGNFSAHRASETPGAPTTIGLTFDRPTPLCPGKARIFLKFQSSILTPQNTDSLLRETPRPIWPNRRSTGRNQLPAGAINNAQCQDLRTLNSAATAQIHESSDTKASEPRFFGSGRF